MLTLNDAIPCSICGEKPKLQGGRKEGRLICPNYKNDKILHGNLNSDRNSLTLGFTNWWPFYHDKRDAEQIIPNIVEEWNKIHKEHLTSSYFGKFDVYEYIYPQSEKNNTIEETKPKQLGSRNIYWELTFKRYPCKDLYDAEDKIQNIRNYINELELEIERLDAELCKPEMLKALYILEIESKRETLKEITENLKNILEESV